MALINLIDVSKQYDHKKILNQVSCTINENERIAIIGQNGSGKSTLIKILSGDLEADSGQRMIKNNLKIISLSQHQNFHSTKSVYEICENSLDDLYFAHKRLQEIEKILNENQNKELLLEQSEWLDFITRHNAWNLEDKIKEILYRFKLEELKDRLVSTLSGGEQKRLALATILLKKADIFFLDEPTNHLDVESVEFLEEEISQLKSSVVFISHDRYFIDELAHRILEVDAGKITGFQGGYQKYLCAKREMLQRFSKEHENLLKVLKNEEEWLRKGVQARRKRNEGRKARVLELREKAKKNPSLIKKMQLELQREQNNIKSNQPKNNKKMIFELQNVGKKIGDKNLIQSLNFRVLQHDKIAIVGKNGSGKSTLLKILLGEEKVDFGKVISGEVNIGYFDQQKSFLDDDKTLLETFCPNGGDHVEVYGKSIHVYGYLKNFLFPKEFLTQKIGFLSGGEKNRVGLALLFTRSYDCLVLDEPTNDLDIQTINILEEYLQNFPGSIVFVSHDRYFVDKIADKLLIFEGNGIINESYMGYSDYLENQKEIGEYDYLLNQIQDEKKVQYTRVKTQNKLSYKEQRELELLPHEIKSLEDKVRDLEDILSNPANYKDKSLLSLSQELELVKNELEEKVEQYFALEEKKDKLSNESGEN